MDAVFCSIAQPQAFDNQLGGRLATELQGGQAGRSEHVPQSTPFLDTAQSKFDNSAESR